MSFESVGGSSKYFAADTINILDYSFDYNDEVM